VLFPAKSPNGRESDYLPAFSAPSDVADRQPVKPHHVAGRRAYRIPSTDSWSDAIVSWRTCFCAFFRAVFAFLAKFVKYPAPGRQTAVFLKYAHDQVADVLDAHTRGASLRHLREVFEGLLIGLSNPRLDR